MENEQDTSIKLVFPELPRTLRIYQKTNPKTGSVYVEVHSSIHVEKVIVSPMSWSADFVRDRYKTFLRDVREFVIKRYGLEEAPLTYIYSWQAPAQ